MEAELSQLKSLSLRLAMTSSREDIRRTSLNLHGAEPEVLIEELLKLFSQDVAPASTLLAMASPADAWLSRSKEGPITLSVMTSAIASARPNQLLLTKDNLVSEASHYFSQNSFAVYGKVTAVF